MKKKRTKSQQPRLPFHHSGGEKTIIYTDGASRGNPGNAGIGVILKSDNKSIEKIKSYLGIRTNNQAEYEALITALKKVNKSHLHIFTDSLLLANQITGKWRVKNPNLGPLYKKAKELISGFEHVSIIHIGREQNKEADRLANEAIDGYLNRSGE